MKWWKCECIDPHLEWCQYTLWLLQRLLCSASTSIFMYDLLSFIAILQRKLPPGPNDNFISNLHSRAYASITNKPTTYAITDTHKCMHVIHSHAYAQRITLCCQARTQTGENVLTHRCVRTHTSILRIWKKNMYEWINVRTENTHTHTQPHVPYNTYFLLMTFVYSQSSTFHCLYSFFVLLACTPLSFQQK